MLKQKIIKVCFFTAMITFSLFVNHLILAEDCADKKDVMQTPTAPGNTEYPEDWRNQYRPIIYASDDEIAPEGTITLYVDSGGTACPPYQWSVSGEGYTIQDDDGDQETDNDLETVTLTAPTSSGTCGVDYDIVAAVTVTDNCGQTDEVDIRNTAGRWKREQGILICEAGGGAPYSVLGNVVPGKYRYCLHYGDGGLDCSNGVLCCNSCAAQILSNLEAYGFDTFVGNLDCYTKMNVESGGTQLRCGTNNENYQDRIQRRLNNPSFGFYWWCLYGISLHKHGWVCP